MFQRSWQLPPYEVSYIGSLSDEQPIVGVAEIHEVEGGADQDAEAPVEEVGPVAAPQLEGVITPDQVVISDIVLRPTSSVRDLRAAAKYLGVSQAGSKTRMFERICSCHILALRRRSLELAEQAYQQEEVQPRETYSSTRQLSERERRLHEITFVNGARFVWQENPGRTTSTLLRPKRSSSVSFQFSSWTCFHQVAILCYCSLIHGLVMFLQQQWKRRVQRPLQIQSVSSLVFWVISGRLRLCLTMNQ